MPERVRRFAPAKINLALHVTGRRPDGYHVLDTLAVFADIGDRVVIDAADELTLSVTGPFAAHAPAVRTNLAWRAAALLSERDGLCRRRGDPHREEHPGGRRARRRFGRRGGGAAGAERISGVSSSDRDELAAHRLEARCGRADVPRIAARSARAASASESSASMDGPTCRCCSSGPGGRSRPPRFSPSSAAARTRRYPTLMWHGVPQRWRTFLLACRNDLEAPALAIAPEIGEALERSARRTAACSPACRAPARPASGSIRRPMRPIRQPRRSRRGKPDGGSQPTG